MAPSARPSAHFRHDVVHRVIHGDTQLVDTFAHLRFHGISAAAQHHACCGAGHQTGAHTDPKPGTTIHIRHSFSGMGVVCPEEWGKTAKAGFAKM